MSAEEEAYTGRVVPAYALTRGRTQSVGGDLPLETLVTATEFGRSSSARPGRSRWPSSPPTCTYRWARPGCSSATSPPAGT